MTGAELFDRFVVGQATTAEIATADVADWAYAQQIHEMRESEPDDIDMSDLEIAEAILAYAVADVTDCVPEGDRCGFCGERRMDWLVWQEDEIHLRCGICGVVFQPESTED